jgi:hypothetical protein
MRKRMIAFEYFTRLDLITKNKKTNPILQVTYEEKNVRIQKH